MPVVVECSAKRDRDGKSRGREAIWREKKNEAAGGKRQDRREGANCQLETEKRPSISNRHRTVTLPVPNQTFSTAGD